MKTFAKWAIVLALGAAPWVAWAQVSEHAEQAAQPTEGPAAGGGHGDHTGTGAATGAGTGHGGHGGGHGAAAGGHDAHGGGAGAAHEGGEHELGEINWFDFSNKKQPPYAAYLANLGILLWIYWSMGKKAVPKMLKERRDSIAKEIEEAQRIEKEAKARAKKYQKKLENLDEEVEATRKALVDAGQGEKERIVREAHEKAARMERDAKALLENELAQARADLTAEAIEAAIATAEDLLKKRATQADQECLAEEFLTQLARRDGGARATGGPGGPGGPVGPAGGPGHPSIPPLAQTGGAS